MSTLNINGSYLGNALLNILTCDEIVPGATPSYQICKDLLAFHPLGAKLAEAPIALAMSQRRTINVPGGPEERLVTEFDKKWADICADKLIFNLMRLSRAYGSASIALMPEDGKDPAEQVDFKSLYKQAELKFNVFDPLNTAGSLVLGQTPGSPDFLKFAGTIRVDGEAYHASRTVVKFNEEPIYLEYTNSSFGYVGRSVYQRALFPLRSFIQSMLTDDLIIFKCGVLVEKAKPAGSIVDRVAKAVAGVKRVLIKGATTGNVLTIGIDESIETLDMKNLDGPYNAARTNILKNIATAADMKARLLENETMVSGFGEGTEDAKSISQDIDRVRLDMAPTYAYFDGIVQHLAWNPEFYATIQADYPEDYGHVKYEDAFFRWRSAFTPGWPSLLAEPPSETAKVDDIKLKAVIAAVQVLGPKLDPANSARLVEWAADCMNLSDGLFPTSLVLDYEALAAYTPPTPSAEPGAPAPFAESE